MKYFIVSGRTIFFYGLIVVVYKWMGKREIGELSIVDFIVSLFIAELVAISIDDYQESFFISFIPIMILVFLQILTSHISFQHKKMRDVLDGKPSVIVNRGRVNFREMKRIRYNLDDLLCQLRGQSIKSLAEIDYAILETNGKLSVFKNEKDHQYPLALILDGTIEEDVLFEIHKTKEWLMRELEKQNLLLENIFYGFYQDNHLFIIEKDKIK